MKKSIVAFIMFIFVFFSNSAFAQISIEEITVGSSDYGPKYTPPFIMVTIKNISNENQDNILIRAFVDNQPMLNEVKIEVLLPGQEKELRFYWEPELGEAKFTFRVEVLNSVFKDGVLKMAKPVSSDQIQIVMKIAHKVNPPVHQYIAFEALEILKGYTLYSEMSNYIGKCDEVYGHEHPYDDSGTTICEGAEEEDQWGDSGISFEHFYPVEPGDDEITYFTHFWNPNGGYTDGIFGFWSAIQKAQKYWSDMVIPYYQNGDNANAYYWLGHIAHLLTDMSVPAHVHEDEHYEYGWFPGLGDDSYEEYMEENNDKQPYNYLQWNADGLTPKNYKYLSISPDYDYSGLPQSQGWDEEEYWDKIALFKLFVNLAEASDNFDSDDADGEINKGSLRYYKILELGYDIKYEDCKDIGDTLMPLAMRYVAGLYQLFWDATRTRIPRLTGNLDFGEVTKGNKLQRTMKIYNDGNSTLSVTSISYPSGFSGSWSGTISAGSYKNVTITFAPTSVKSYSGTLTVNCNKTSGTNTKSLSGTGTDIVQVYDSTPKEFKLFQNYPNPFNPVTTISFSLPEACHVILKIYNTLGEEVVTLVDNSYSAGIHSIEWDASDLSSGIYFYRLQAGMFEKTKKLLLMK